MTNIYINPALLHEKPFTWHLLVDEEKIAIIYSIICILRDSESYHDLFKTEAENNPLF